jgi:hypothetical protein
MDPTSKKDFHQAFKIPTQWHTFLTPDHQQHIVLGFNTKPLLLQNPGSCCSMSFHTFMPLKCKLLTIQV